MGSTGELTQPWRPSGIVTLTTDLGLRDTFVGVMKGVLAGLAPRVVPVDLTHERSRQLEF